MATPTGTQTTPMDFQKLIKMLSEELNEDAIVREMQTMAATKRGKMTFGVTVDKASHRKHALTIRITPELHGKWIEVLKELSTATATSSPEIKKRASASFTTALQDGQLVIEVDEGGKMQAFASQETAAKLQKGELELHGKNGSVKHYDNVNVIDKKGFQDLAKSIVSMMQHAPAPSVSVSSEEIAPSQNGTPTAKTPTPPLPPKTPTPQKKVTSPAKPAAKAPAVAKEEETRKEDKLAEATTETLKKEAQVIAKEDERKTAKIAQDATKTEDKKAESRVEAEAAELPNIINDENADPSSGKTAP